jgi:hypothetical protein
MELSMRVQELIFASGRIRYFNDDVVDEKTMLHRTHIFQQTQSKFWSVVLEAFAVHYDFLRENVSRIIRENGNKDAAALVKKTKPKFAVKSVANSHESLVIKDSPSYACFPDSAIDELEGLLRATSKDVSAINWFCYQCARRAFREIGTDLLDRWLLQNSINKVEREGIMDIIAKQHIIHYPRPADQRDQYLKDNNIEKLVLVLA